MRSAAGRTDLRVDGGGTGMPESLLETVRQVPGVETAVPVLESPAYPTGGRGELLTVLGVDLLEEDRVRRYASDADEERVIEDPLVFLSQPNSIVLTRSYAARRHLKSDDTIELQAPRGRRSFVVRGLLADRGPAVARLADYVRVSGDRDGAIGAGGA